MKKTCSVLFIFCSLLIGGKLNAQYCGNSGPGACVVLDTLSSPGFQNPNSVPCGVQGDTLNQPIQIKMFNTFNFLGMQNVDSIRFVAIGNLPCGLCWATSNPTNTFKANEAGCINISGTTEDTAGQYQFTLTLDAFINGSSGIPADSVRVLPSLVNETGIRVWYRVQNAAGTCQPVDTSSSYTGNTAHSGCPTAINEISSDISLLSITPDPVNTSAVMSFNAIKAEPCQMRISDIAGKVISSKELQVTPGLNTSVIERNNLPAGIYFMTLTQGKSVVTRKFAVVE
jgi:hypothetical protein